MNRAIRRIPIMAACVVSLAQAASNGYEEVRDLSLNAGGIGSLDIEAGAGSLEVTGVAETGTIVVKAIVQVPDEDQGEAREIIESDLVLGLERDGDRAELKGYFEDRSWLSGNSGSVRLEVTMPEGMSLVVEDSSGSIVIRNVAGDLDLEDGSGSIKMTEVGGRVTVDDGSGSIAAEGVGGDVKIVDGSGSLSLLNVEGDVTIDDGSGGVTVSGVAGNLTVLSDGSGSLNVTDVRGEFVNET